ncbi:MAG: acyltransferase [Candidatus Marithrix sp.]|nr:acyltransferase [Candidatus Marithrix sp.]
MMYRSEIDGLRAIAVIPVILFHAGFSTFSGGFVGVDIFFVISGYLITTIILTEMEQGTFSLVKFYERRARRILPALYIVILVSLPFAWFLSLPNEMKDFSQSLVAVSSFSSNILFWYESGYWDTAGELKPLLHTWSLAVEEQYYVLFPLFLMLMWHYRKRWILGSFTIIAVISLAAAQWGAYHNPSATFYLLPTRGWELAIGAGIAFYFLYRKQTIQTFLLHRSVNELLGLLGLLMIGYGIFVFDEKTPFPSFYALIPTIGTGLIILFASSKTITGRLLSTKLLVLIGLISYSAYLWHQPLLAFARQGTVNDLSSTTYAILAFLSLPLAYLSWRFIEKPFRTKDVFSQKEIFLFFSIGSVLFITIGLAGHFTKGFENFWLSRQSQTIQTTHNVINKRTGGNNYGTNKEGKQDDGVCRFNIPKLHSDIKQRIKDCYKKYNKGYVILGDSHAADLFGVVTSSNSHPFIIGITLRSCRPYMPGCQYDDFLNFVRENKDIFYGVIYEQAGFNLLRNKEKKGNKSMIADIPYGVEVNGIYPDEERIYKVYTYIKNLSDYINVVWFGSRIEPQITIRTILKRGCDSGFMLRPKQREVFEKLDSYIDNLITDTNSLRFISQNKVFNYRFPADFMDCKGIYWIDGNHLGGLGEKMVGKRFDVMSLFVPQKP